MRHAQGAGRNCGTQRLVLDGSCFEAEFPALLSSREEVVPVWGSQLSFRLGVKASYVGGRPDAGNTSHFESGRHDESMLRGFYLHKALGQWLRPLKQKHGNMQRVWPSLHKDSVRLEQRGQGSRARGALHRAVQRDARKNFPRSGTWLPDHQRDEVADSTARCPHNAVLLDAGQYRAGRPCGAEGDSEPEAGAYR